MRTELGGDDTHGGIVGTLVLLPFLQEQLASLGDIVTP